MNTYNMELDSIVESFKLDILAIEHENFMNIMYNKSEGVLNESVLLEFKQSKIKMIINKIKEAFKKLGEKVKKIIEKIKKSIQSKFYSLAFNDLKKLPDDVDLGKRIDIDWVINKFIPVVKKSDQIFLQICDKISKIDTKMIASANQDIDDINDILTKDDNEWGQMIDEYEQKLSSKNSYNGKYLKTQYPKIISTSKNLLNSANNDSQKLYKSLMQADRKIDDLGKNFTYSTTSQNIGNTIKYGDASDINSKEYNGDDKNNSVEFVEFASRYIKLYTALCKNLVSVTRQKYFAVRECTEIVLKGLSLLGDNAKNHAGYNYYRGRISYTKGGKYDPDPDFSFDDFEDIDD